MKTLLVCVLVLLSLSVVDALAGDMQKTIERDLAKWEKRYGNDARFLAAKQMLEDYKRATKLMPTDHRLWRETGRYVEHQYSAPKYSDLRRMWTAAIEKIVPKQSSIPH